MRRCASEVEVAGSAHEAGYRAGLGKMQLSLLHPPANVPALLLLPVPSSVFLSSSSPPSAWCGVCVCVSLPL